MSSKKTNNNKNQNNKSHKIEIFSLEGCGYSMAAEQLLKEHDIPFNRISVSQETKEHHKKINEMNTFPQIFLNKSKKNRSKIGGFTELEAYIQIIKILCKLDIQKQETVEHLIHLHKFVCT